MDTIKDLYVVFDRHTNTVVDKMKKLIGQLTVGDKVFVRVGGSKFKSACEVKEIVFNNLDEEFENATILLDDGVNQYRQNWYVIESIEVIS